jgi:ATP-dependent DNA helicase UvrD/PcrA
VKILQLLAGEERNAFAVGDPDQAIYRFRGASSAAFELFRHHFLGAQLVVLEKNRRSTSPILHCGFALIAKNPQAFLAKDIAYQRSPLVSARDEEAVHAGGLAQRVPVEAVIWLGRDAECSDVVTAIRERKRQSRCAWSKIAVLYRLHSHRDEVAAELAAQGIPFSIENMDVMDTPEVRDLLACLGAVSSVHDSTSLFRVAALPQFAIDPRELRAEMRALPKDSNEGVSSVLEKVKGGAALLDGLQQTREEISRAGGKARDALEIILRRFALQRTPAVAAVLDFAAAWEEKPLTKTGETAEFLDYLDYFRQAGGVVPMTSGDEDGVRLMTVHAAKGLEWDHVFILRANSNSFPASYRQFLVEFPNELRDPDSVADGESKELQGQEERRMFYVAMTRARDTLAIYARRGRGKKDPRPDGYVRDLLVNPGEGLWLRKRDVHGAQMELAAEAAEVEETAVRAAPSQIGNWLKLPPGCNLGEKLSATAIETYETCPLQFKFERDWRIPRAAPAAMQYGAAMHRVLRTFYDAQQMKRGITDEELIELFRADLERAGIQERYQQELYEKQGVVQLRDFLAANRKAAMPEVLHSEEWFEVSIGASTVVGRIDRMDRAQHGRVTITDYKTGKPRSQEDADKSLQLSIYALAAREKWGYEADALVFYNLEGNAPVVTRRSGLQLQEAKLKVEEVAGQIEAGKFQAKPDFHCRFCPYRNLCPATEKRLY